MTSTGYEFFRNREKSRSGRRISDWTTRNGVPYCMVQYVRRDKEKEAYWDDPEPLMKYRNEQYIPYKTIPQPLMLKIVEASLNEQ